MRRNYYTGKYPMTRNQLRHAKAHAYRYHEWRDEYEALEDTSRGIRYDQDRVETSGDFDPVESAGIRRAELSKKIEIIEQTAMEADKDLFQWILQGVTDEFASYKYLRMIKGIPCSYNTYYDKIHRFYYLLSQKI
jgi:uncharacterized glyoxalase superfamily metalloenzyme YdcJ